MDRSSCYILLSGCTRAQKGGMRFVMQLSVHEVTSLGQAYHLGSLHSPLGKKK